MTPADRLLLGALIVDGLFIGVLSVFLGAPLGVVLALIANTLLVWLAAQFTDSPLRWGPVVAWLVVVLIVGMGGPGGDVVLVTDAWGIALLIAGVVGPLVLNWRGLLD